MHSSTNPAGRKLPQREGKGSFLKVWVLGPRCLSSKIPPSAVLWVNTRQLSRSSAVYCVVVRRFHAKSDQNALLCIWGRASHVSAAAHIRIAFYGACGHVCALVFDAIDLAHVVHSKRLVTPTMTGSSYCQTRLVTPRGFVLDGLDNQKTIKACITLRWPAVKKFSTPAAPQLAPRS